MNRLSKIMATAGVASRRACEQLIFEGRVTVNGQVVTTPQTHVCLSKDAICVNGERLKAAEKKMYYMLNKPTGYLCTARSNPKKKIVLNLFAGVNARLFTVGRLDKDTSGLLIVTNDGHFANQIIHPSSNIQKEYLAKTGQEITHQHLLQLSKGTWIEGTYVKPKRVAKVRRGTLKIILGEGKKREVRILLERAGLDVHELSRIRIGKLPLGNLPLGAWRELTPVEKELVLNK